ncbi:MAG: B12-binding domain-containing radical SAM protein [Bacteroidota bacterium]
MSVKSTKIVLVPPIINPFIQRREEDFIPLGLLSLAACLNKKYQVKIYSPKYPLLKNEDYRYVVHHILNMVPHIIGFSTWCISYPSSLLLAKAIKKAAPKIPVIFGGPQATALAKETLQLFPFIDFILTGEADYSFPHFVNEWHKSQPDYSTIPGLFYFDTNGNILHNQPGNITNEMDKLPVPAYHLFPKQESIKLDAGRGCPFHCTYCSTNNFFSRKYRIKSVDRIGMEMLTAHQQMNIKHFGFTHDMFTLNKKHISQLCSKLIYLNKTKNTGFKWTCSARIDCVNHEMLIQMREAGCQSIFFGIESGSEKIQKSIRKNLDISKVYPITDLCRKIGLNMHASFILGFPEEDITTVEKTLQCILKLAMKGAFVQISELSLLPGTKLYNAHKNNLKFDGKFSGFSRTVCGPEELKLIKKHPEIFSSFYYLPVNTLNRDEMVFLNHLINKIGQFRNTLFLLSPLLEKDIERNNILQLFKKEFRRIKWNGELTDPVVSHWIRIINSYIHKHKEHLHNNYLNDVFAFESLQATLKTLYRGWKMFRNEQHSEAGKNGDIVIQPTPFGKLLSTRYKLETILPSENQWQKETVRCKKGHYFYLMAVVSETECQKMKLSEKEFFLLKNLRESTYSEFKKSVSSLRPKTKADSWITKLQRLGVIQLNNQTA